MSDLLERARWWSYDRQRLGRAGSDADRVLRDVVGVYSAHPTAPLSLLARCDPFDAAAFHALDALRLPAMRGSIHLLPRATAHLAFRAVPEVRALPGQPLDALGLDRQGIERLRAAVLEAARAPRSARELRALTGAQTTLAPLLGALTREGLLLRVGAPGLRSNELLYVSGEVAAAGADESLAWLAEQYLRAFGPARPRDFAWWAGVSAARAGVALDGLDSVELGDGMLLLRADVEGFERACAPAGSVDLLPKWDCYTMGYPSGGRGRLADDDVVAELYEDSGDARPVVLVDGRAAGTWGVRPGSDLEFQLDLLEPPGPSLRRALEQRAAAVRALLRE